MQKMVDGQCEYSQKKDTNGDGFIDQDERRRKVANGSRSDKKVRKPKE